MSRKKEDHKKESVEEDKKEEKEMCLKLEELENKTKEYDALWDKHLRVCADFDNTRKRWEKERGDLVKFANFCLLRELIVIVDELEHALDAIEGHSAKGEIKKGIEMTSKNLFSILKKEGVEIIEAKGKKFDPHVHEIVGQKEADELEEHIVLEEAQRGYLLSSKVLRTSKVIVAVKGKEEKESGVEIESEANGEVNEEISDKGKEA